MADMVNHPPHYMSGGMEAIDVIEAFFANKYHRGQVFKYLVRAGKKVDELEDLQKAEFYLKREIKRVKAERAKPKTSGGPIIPGGGMGFYSERLA